jgi:glycosyltransferase involved in cell wall biosynthesis
MDERGTQQKEVPGFGVSIVIPAYNEEFEIGSCIDSVKKYGGSHIKEIIVVDNASTDRTAQIATAHGAFVVHEPRKGTNNARQSGAEVASRNIIAFIDADTRVPPGWVEKIEEAFADPQVALMSGPYRYIEAPWHWRLFLNAVWWTSPITYFFFPYIAMGGNVVVRRQFFEAVGGFDRKFTFYGDDTDLAQRMHAVGKTLWRMDFFIYSSARRFRADGIIKTNTLYMLNYFWSVLFGRPYTLTHEDFRAIPEKKEI